MKKFGKATGVLQFCHLNKDVEAKGSGRTTIEKQTTNDNKRSNFKEP